MELDKLKPQVEVTEQQKKKKEEKTELRHLGVIKPKRGHKVFEFNRKTNEIKEAEFENGGDVDFDQAQEAINKKGRIASRKKLIVKGGHSEYLYLTALNKKNAEKRLKRNGYL